HDALPGVYDTPEASRLVPGPPNGSIPDLAPIEYRPVRYDIGPGQFLSGETSLGNAPRQMEQMEGSSPSDHNRACPYDPTHATFKVGQPTHHGRGHHSNATWNSHKDRIKQLYS